jgi:hypothetical protein
MLQRVFELEIEVAIFVRDSSNKDDKNLRHNEDFIQKVACLVYIFLKKLVI